MKHIVKDFLPTKAKIMLGQQKAPLRPLVTKKVVIMEGGQNQKATETRRYRVKELFHFVGCYHQFPEELLLIWM